MLARGNKATWAGGIQVQLYPAASVGWVEAGPVKQRPRAEPNESGSLSQPLQSASTQSTQRVRLLQCEAGPCFYAPGFGLRARGTGRSPEASASTKKVQDSRKETPGPGCAEKGPVAPHSSPRRLWHFLRARGDPRPPSSAPAAGTPHGLDPGPPAPPAGGKLLLSAQPGHRDRPLGGRQGGPRGLARSAGCQNPHPVAFSGSRFALCRENP